MIETPWVCAVIIGENVIIPEKFGRKYKTVIVEGKIELIDEQETKRQVMTWVGKRKSPGFRQRKFHRK